MERTVEPLLYRHRSPWTFEAIRVHYPETSERTLYCHLAELREVAGLYQHSTGRYTIPVRMFLADTPAAEPGNHQPRASAPMERS